MKLLCIWLGSGEDKKANWPNHLAEIVHVYNATWSTVVGYSPHYLMFGHRPRLPVNFFFPTLRSAEVPTKATSTYHVDKYITTVWDCLQAALQDAKIQSAAEAQWQKWYYDWKVGPIGLKPGDLVLVKVDAFQGKRKIKDRWEDKSYEVICQIMTDVPSYKVKDPQRNSGVLHHNGLLHLTSEVDIPLCAGFCQSCNRCISSIPGQTTPGRSERVRMPQKQNSLWVTQCQARLTDWGG